MDSPPPEPIGPDAGPAYAGAADRGVRSSVPPGDPMIGDAASVIRAELEKLDDLYGDIVALLDVGRLDEVGQRWFGVVRETLEFQAACRRVVLPAVADAVALPQGTDPGSLIERLSPHDELNPDLRPDEVLVTATATVEALRSQRDVLLAAVQALGPGERARLGEDLRQVMG